MSKALKTRAREKRAREKKARKEAKKALYESYKRQGINSKSKRSRVKTKLQKTGPRKKNHVMGRCGNPGCIKCYGINYNPFLKNGEPHKMPQWMWIQWKKEQKAA